MANDTAKTSEPTRSELISRADSKAMAALRKNHLEEFNSLKRKAAEKLGVDWSPKPTPKEKAKAQLDALISAFPDLLDNDSE